MTPTTKQYYAFISYKRDDQKWAEWLQEKLEHYKLPTNLNGRSDLPKEIRPVFRDKSELAAGVLADEIQKALDNSKYLIVICSPHSAKSEWVNKEVQAFIESGRTDKIIPFIIEGVPNSGNDETECFPKAIRELPAEDELLGVNINEMGRDAAAVKVIAQMFGLRFDDLWQRHEREKKRKRNWIITASVMAFLVMVGIAGWIWHQNVKLKEKDWKMMENQSRFVSEKVEALIKQGDSYLARILATEILPKDLENPDRPYVSDAERVLREATRHNTLILKGHTNSVRNYFFTSDGKKVISSEGFCIKIWDVINGACIKNINGQSSEGPAISTRGDIAEINYNDSVIVIKDAENDIIKKEIPIAIDGNIDEIVFSPNGKKLMVVFDDDIHIYDLDKGIEENVIEKGYLNIFSQDGEYVISIKRVTKEFTFDEMNSKYFDGVSRYDFKTDKQFYSFGDNEIIINSIKTGGVINKIKTSVNVRCVWCSPDVNIIAAMDYDGIIHIIDINTKKEMYTIEGDVSCRYTPDTKYMVTADVKKGVLRIWDIVNGENVRNIDLTFLNNISGKYVLGGFKISPDGEKILVSSGNLLYLLDFVEKESYSDVIETKGGNESFYDSYSRDGKCFITTSEKNVLIWDAETKECNRIIDGQDGYVIYVEFSPDCNYIVSISDNGILNLWDFYSGECVKKIELSASFGLSARFSPDSKKIVSVSKNIGDHYDSKSYVEIWDVSTGEKITGFNELQALPQSASFSADGNKIASNTAMPYFYLFDLVNCSVDSVGNGFNKWYNKIEFSHNGKYIVTTENGIKEIYVWDSETKERILELKGHESYVSFVAFSNDDKYLVSTSMDNTIRVWDVATGECVNKIELNNGSYESYVAFAPNGREIMYLNKDFIFFYDFPPLQDLIDQTRERFKNRPLTEEERKMYYLE